MAIYFYDTCALLNLQERAFDSPFIISSETLRELERIKASASKDQSVKYKARNITRLLIERYDTYQVYHTDYEASGDERIRFDASCAAAKQPVVFVSDDLMCRLLARIDDFTDVIGTEALLQTDDEYKGFRILNCDDDETLARFYENLNVNTAECGINEYVLLEKDGTHIDIYKWTDKGYQMLFNKILKGNGYLNDIKPKDLYQRAAIDSIMTNMITCISGPAGSGKSLLALASCMHLLKRGTYDRIVMLVNPAKAYGAVDMGFYPGTSQEKLMANFVGNMLATKFGDQYGVDMLINQDKLRVISMADVRGMEIRDNEILYISECQNTTVDLMKLCLSRVGAGAKVIFEGDYSTQVDSWAYAGNRNGMRRAIDVLKGSSLFGYVELQNIWRSPLADLIEKM